MEYTRAQLHMHKSLLAIFQVSQGLVCPVVPSSRWHVMTFMKPVKSHLLFTRRSRFSHAVYKMAQWQIITNLQLTEYNVCIFCIPFHKNMWYRKNCPRK